MTGRELKRLRYNLKLSLAQASAQVEVSPRTWCRWESGETPVPERAVKLFKLLNKIKSADRFTDVEVARAFKVPVAMVRKLR
jgi:DNA-binding transcriptional regulator YiaG